MYVKLILRNAKRSAKDYLIYIVTLTICVMLFYGFLSISSKYYHPSLGMEYDITVLGNGMKYAICAITLLLFFLIAYVNSFMIRRKQKEFAIQTMMGMEQRTTAWLFFAETLCMGLLSIIAGTILGMIASQFVTAMLLDSYGEQYHFLWTFFPDTILLTISVFFIMFFLIGLQNVHKIRKIKIIDMLNAQKQGDGDFKKSHFMPTVAAVFGITHLFMIRTGFACLKYYYDPRLPLPVQILYWGNLILPALGILSFLLFLLQMCFKSRKNERFLYIWAVFAVLEGSFAACVPKMTIHYFLPLNSGMFNQFLLFLIVDIIYLVCALFYLSSNAITAWKNSSLKHKYHNENLFFYGQLLSKLKTTTKTMSLICLTLILSILLFAAVPALIGWALGYLEMRTGYDIQIFSNYNAVRYEYQLPDENYSVVDEFLADENIEIIGDCLVELYLPNADQFHQRNKYNFPVAAISLSDYNTLRNMYGYELVSFKDNQFMIHFQSIMTKDERTTFLESNKLLKTDSGTLQLAEDACRDESVGETLFNSYTDALYIFPDEICKKLLCVMNNRYINTHTPLSYVQANTLEQLFSDFYFTQNTVEEGPHFDIRTKTNQINGSRTSCFLLQTCMTYGALVLLIICFTVLALQLLSDAPNYQYRFGVLRKMGVDEDAVHRLIWKQLSVWFGLPVLLAVFMATIFVTYFFHMISVQITAYIGAGVLFSQIVVITIILLLLLLCYFIVTWILFKRACNDSVSS